MRKYNWQVDPSTIKDEDKVVLYITDMHLPFSKPEYLDWVKNVAIQFDVNTIVHGGDIVDNHALSFHDNEPDAMGAEDELEEALVMIKGWVELFPYVYYTIGNHDAIPQRKAAAMGLSTRYLRSFSQLLGLPDTWLIADSHIINGVKYEHGHRAKGGVHGAFNTAINNRMSTCTGHFHSNYGIKYQNNGGDTIFGLAGGCLVDNDRYAFRYGLGSANKPIVGVSVIYNSSFAVSIPYIKEVK